ncbi:hypothetical protein L6164_025159 [Bauhinia variegata]|uniref:Uncharacterized protein n=1 Tax=Bauhinia variegata TaxID=167791 RepID=A0ACB9M126_BAUVA|nr:hypothetical protein L6164_025159 [Bauhinia variegata]
MKQQWPIGIEPHVNLASLTKAFCSCPTIMVFYKILVFVPTAWVCLCALLVLNSKLIEFSVKVGLGISKFHVAPASPLASFLIADAALLYFTFHLKITLGTMPLYR